MPKGPNGLTHRQEKFCRAFVLYGSSWTASSEAGYAPRWSVQHGRRLMRQPRIRARIAELQAEMAHDSCRETEVLLGKLEAVYRRALADHHFYAAARAVDLQARLAGQRAAATARVREGAAGAHLSAEASAKAEPPEIVGENAEMTTNGYG